jgi:hypothetical protein
MWKYLAAIVLISGSIPAIAQTQINPNTQIRWPASCSTLPVYSPATNQCVSTGTAANPAGSAGDVQCNGGGIFSPCGGISIAQGGTGATTAAGALTNLGALPLAGGTMLGSLILFHDPVTGLEATTKQYTDTNFVSKTSVTTQTMAASLNTPGLQLGGLAAVGHYPCGNGTVYVDCLFPAIPTYTLYYQTLYSNAVVKTQRNAINFSGNFLLGDSASPSWTNVDLSATGIVPGTYTQATCTFDSYGRASACSSNASSRIVATVSFTSCSMVNYSASDQNCTATRTWGATLPAGYQTYCSIIRGSWGGGDDTTGLILTTVGIVDQSSTTQFTYYIANDHTSAATRSVPLNCMAVK